MKKIFSWSADFFCGLPEELKIVRFDDSVSFIGRKKNLKDIRYHLGLNFDVRHSNCLFLDKPSPRITRFPLAHIPLSRILAYVRTSGGIPR